ncbi:MAG: hypothetical protein ACREMS_02615 [Gemmatimonadaceae bacterium]
MRVYVAVTGLLFILVAISHVVRAFAERNLFSDIGFIVLTLLLVVLAAWAAWLLRKNPTPPGANVES